MWSYYSYSLLAVNMYICTNKKMIFPALICSDTKLGINKMENIFEKIFELIKIGSLYNGVLQSI